MYLSILIFLTLESRKPYPEDKSIFDFINKPFVLMITVLAFAFVMLSIYLTFSE